MISMDVIKNKLQPEQSKDILAMFKGDQLKAAERYGMFFREGGKTGKSFEEIETDETVATAAHKVEGGRFTEISPASGQALKIHKQTWGAFFAWTREVQEYEKYDEIARMTKVLGHLPTDTVSDVAIAHIELGTSLSGIPTIDGVPLVRPCAIDKLSLWNTAHTFRSSAVTNSNYLAASSIDETGLGNLASLPYGWKNENGQFVKRTMGALIVPVALRLTAARYLKTTKQVGTANNDINTVSEDFGAGDYQVARELTSTTAFYAKMQGGKQWSIRWGWKPKTMQGIDHTTECPRTSMDFAFGLETADWSNMVRAGS